MRECVIAHYVPGFHHLARNVGALLNVTTDEEKCCFHFMTGQDFQ